MRTCAKIIVALLVAITIVGSTTTETQASSKMDEVRHEKYLAMSESERARLLLEAAAHQGIIEPQTLREFDPIRKATHADFAKMLGNIPRASVLAGSSSSEATYEWAIGIASKVFKLSYTGKDCESLISDIRGQWTSFALKGNGMSRIEALQFIVYVFYPGLEVEDYVNVDEYIKGLVSVDDEDDLVEDYDDEEELIEIDEKDRIDPNTEIEVLPGDDDLDDEDD